MTKLDQYISSLHGKKVVVLGIGVSNIPLIRLLLSDGIEVTACDRTTRDKLSSDVLALEQLGAKLRLGDNYLEGLSADVVFRTPGMHPDKTEIRSLVASGAELTSEMEVFFQVCPCKIIAVTGSDGKTTTTTIISEMLKHAGYRVWIGGNIGQPLLSFAGQMSEEDFAVVELSSFQLMTMKQSPDIAVITNLAPNHLDVHKDMDEYIQAKENIYLHQSQNNTVVLNLDNHITASFASKARGSVRLFSRHKVLHDSVSFHDHRIYMDGKEILRASDIILPGIHNVENYMAAICAVRDFVTVDDIIAVAGSFGGVEHRIEFVRELRGVKYYNDSIASSPTRTIAGLHSFDRKVILIAGGYDKQIPFEELGSEIVCHVKRLILCGDTAEKIKAAVIACEQYRQSGLEIVLYDKLEDAVYDAGTHAVDGDIVTLSPACAAFDQFKNFMVRGNRYKELVAALL